MKKWLVGLTLLMALTVVISGCGTKAADENTGAAPAGNTAGTEQPAGNAGTDPAANASVPGDVSVSSDGNPGDISVNVSEVTPEDTTDMVLDPAAFTANEELTAAVKAYLQDNGVADVDALLNAVAVKDGNIVIVDFHKDAASAMDITALNGIAIGLQDVIFGASADYTEIYFEADGNYGDFAAMIGTMATAWTKDGNLIDSQPAGVTDTTDLPPKSGR
jgi:hypothetical protein